jgi:hypothetical protein
VDFWTKNLVAFHVEIRELTWWFHYPELRPFVDDFPY